jgi:hypothetical protein
VSSFRIPRTNRLFVVKWSVTDDRPRRRRYYRIVGGELTTIMQRNAAIVWTFVRPERRTVLGVSHKLRCVRTKFAEFCGTTGTERKRRTGWRRIESRTNYSLPKFPANREKYREYCTFLRVPYEISTYYRVFWPINLRFYDESKQGTSREYKFPAMRFMAGLRSLPSFEGILL